MAAGGLRKPKNEALSDMVQAEREAIRIRQEPQNAGASQKAIVIRIAVGLTLIAVCVVLPVFVLK